MQRYTPDENQERDIQAIIEEPTKAVLDASEPGAGKTLVACETIVRLEPDTVLIICPLSVRVNFETTLTRQGCDLRQVRIDGTLKGKAAFADLEKGVSGVYVVGREYFRLKDWHKVKPDVVVFDEIHAVQNRKSVGFRQLRNLKAKRLKIGMSGTPAGNRFEGLWSITRWLWPEQVERSFWRWAAEWTKVVDDYFAGKKVVGEREKGAFVKTLPLYLNRRADLDVEYVEEVRYVELTPTQRKIYDQMEADMVMWLEENPSVAEAPVVQRIRLRQITLGVPTMSDEGEITFKEDCKSSKIDALKDIIKDLNDGEPILILTDSAKFARVVAHRLGKKAAVWSGNETHKVREQIKADFLSGSVQWIVATIPAIGEGVDLLQHRANHVVWLSRSENRILNEQAQARLHRKGQDKTVFAFDIRAKDTYDDGQFQRLELQAAEMRASLGKEDREVIEL